MAALEALKIFVKVLGTRPEMLSAVVSYPRINDLITCNVFNR